MLLRDLPVVAAGAGESSPRIDVVRAGTTRIAELDSLRGLAAVGILCLHTMPQSFFWAWSCVDLFFILSGFLITSILIAHAGSPKMLLAFYARRALRIWPVYYLSWAAVALIFLLDPHSSGKTWLGLPSGHWLSLAFLQYTEQYGWIAPAPDYVWYFAHSWSLAVEEQFYALWPLLFFALRPGLRSAAVACIAGLAAAIYARADGQYFYLLVTRIDGLLFGILLAFAAADRDSLFHRIHPRAFAYLAVLALALLVPYLASHGKQPLLGSTRAMEVAAFALGYAAVIGLVLRQAGAAWLAALRFGPLVHLGRLSFAIYMFQVPIGYLGLLAVSAETLSKDAAHAMTWVATLVTAHLSYRFVERHALALKGRFRYAGGSATP